MIPGEIITPPGTLTLNADRKAVRVTVANTGDRPVQVGSHYHFFEVNNALAFDRDVARGDTFVQTNLNIGTCRTVTSRHGNVSGELAGEQACRMHLPRQIPDRGAMNSQPRTRAAPDRSFDSGARDGGGGRGNNPACGQAREHDHGEGEHRGQCDPELRFRGDRGDGSLHGNRASARAQHDGRVHDAGRTGIIDRGGIDGLIKSLINRNSAHANTAPAGKQ